MTTTTNSTVIGVFPDYDQANDAIDELRNLHFSYDRIRLVQHGTGGFVDTLKAMFTGQTSMASSTSDALTKMGMPEYEAQHYQSELDANHVLLLMNADDRPEEAFDTMRQKGAFDITSRFRTASPDGSAETLSSRPSQETHHPISQHPNGSQDGHESAPSHLAPYPGRSQETSNDTSMTPQRSAVKERAYEPSDTDAPVESPQSAEDIVQDNHTL